jgi:hypothetical protein
MRRASVRLTWPRTAIWVGCDHQRGRGIHYWPEGSTLHKSSVKVTAAQHEPATKKGAREIKPSTVIYHQGGKF